LIHLLNRLGISVSIALREKPVFSPSTTHIHWDWEPDPHMGASDHDEEPMALKDDDLAAGRSFSRWSAPRRSATSHPPLVLISLELSWRQGQCLPSCLSGEDGG
jgi:hypothetical protein